MTDLPCVPRLSGLLSRAEQLTAQFNAGSTNKSSKPPLDGVSWHGTNKPCTNPDEEISRVNPLAAAETNCPAALKMLMDTWRSCRKTHESKPVLDDEQAEWLAKPFPAHLRIRASHD